MRKLTIAYICLSLLALSIIGALIFIKTAPEAQKKRPPKMAALVETQKLQQTDETVVLYLTGTVMPAEEVLVRARVTGEIVSLASEFTEGGLLRKGDEMLQIDPIDYQLALTTAQSGLERARFNHKLELGRQDVARREWELLKTDDATELEKELALRIPHLAASKAALQAAEANLKKSQLDLSRTRIQAPFNGVVLERDIDIGSQASLQNTLGKLVGTDTYWISVSIPVDRLRWITIPGSTVRLISTSGAIREGHVIKQLGDLEEKGRLARLLVEIEDPLCLKPENKDKMPLLLGEYIRTEVSGKKLEGVFSIPRNALRENESVWIAANNKLDIRKADVLWRDSLQVIIRDGVDDEVLIISDLTTPIQGMDLNTGNKE
jgi:RND family efflux transporter MFP subunit